MNNLNKGGRGKRAPYVTTHCRIPEPLKALCEELAANYRELVADYSDLKDPALMKAVLLATGGNTTSNTSLSKLEIEKVREDYKAMNLEIERLNEQIEALKATSKKDIISKEIINFIEAEKINFGCSPSQKDKEFNISTRKWDAFRLFIKFVDNIKDSVFWKVGDKCTVLMPSGIKITGAEIASIDRKRLQCKVLVKDTESHFLADLSSLVKP